LWVFSGLDVNDNLHLIETKEPQYLFLKEEDRHKINGNIEQLSKQNNTPFVKVETVEDMLLKDYLIKDGVGIKPTFAIIDRQGHRTNEVQYFASKYPQVMMYQGTSMAQSNWKMSDSVKKLILGAAKHYQSNLIYYLYSQKKRASGFLYFNPNITDDVIKQIVCVKPDASKKFGDAPENWEPENGAQHDWFDVLKMAYLGVEWAVATMKKARWRFCKSPQLQRRWERVLLYQQKQMEEDTEIKDLFKENPRWFNLDREDVNNNTIKDFPMKHTQGFRFAYKVPSADCKLAIRGDGVKIVIDSIESVTDGYRLIVTPEETAQWPSGEFRYQLMDNEGILDEGEFIILKNFILTDEDSCIKTKNELYLEAIEATLAGRATAAQSSMSVGDKSIQYMSVDELLKLRDYFKEKVDKEQNKYSTSNRGRIKYKWSIR